MKRINYQTKPFSRLSKQKWGGTLRIGLLFVIACITCSLNAHSQNVKVNINIHNQSIREVLTEIEKQTGYLFVYSADEINVNKKISLNSKNKNISDILAMIFTDTEISSKVQGKNILLIKEIKYSNQQQFSVKGRVSDNLGDPLPGVNIVVKGEDRMGTVTDMDGNYNLTVPYSNATIVFSFVGFQPQEIKLASRNKVDVTLIDDSKALEEVVVVGYTTQKKASIVGSVASISTKDLQQSPTANINNALAGRMPGLMINQFTGGEPGVDRADINIRGFATYGDKSPIIIVDGVERDMSYLSAEEIESFTILKDASATAQYGVRGANGVIVVTTKRGKAQDKATVSFKAAYGMNKPVQFPEYLGSADYAVLYNEAARNDGLNPAFTKESINNFRRAKGDNSDGLGYSWDYFDYAFKPGTQQDYSLSVRGGSKQARYYIMANYFNQDGNYKHTNLSAYDTQAVFKRYNFRANVDVDITKDFYVKLDLGSRITDRNSPGTDAGTIILLGNTLAPYLPIELPNNNNPANKELFAKNPLGLLYGDQFNRFNILGELSRTGFQNEKNTFLNGSFAIGHKLDFITSGLKAEAIFSYDAEEGRWIKRKVPTYNEGYRRYPGYATFVPTEGVGDDVYKNNPTYKGIYTNGNKYDIDQTIGNEFSHNASKNKVYYQLRLDYARNFGDHDVSALVLFNRSTYARNNEVEFRYQGIASRATYAYAHRYLSEFNIGYNGSENFISGKRYGFFPAAAIGWVVSEEPFMHATRRWLDNMKVRASVGLVGNDKFGDENYPPRFTYIQYFNHGDEYKFGTNDFGSTAPNKGIKEGKMANPNLTWEKARKINVGLDMAFLNNSLTFSVDLFKEKRWDIFTDLSGSNKLGFSNIVGASAPWVNMGKVDNKGIDFEIAWRGKIGKDFTYFIKPNFTFARNKVVFMKEVSRDYPWRMETGKRIDEHFVYVFDHFVADQAEADRLNAAKFQPFVDKLIPGDVVYKDLNGDGKIDDAGDRAAMGNPRTPEIQFGLPITLQYKNFDFSLLLQGAANGSLLLHGPAVYDFPFIYQDMRGKVKKMHLDRWTPETAETAKYPALHLENNTNNKNPNSSLFLYDSKYMRLKNVELGYTLPKTTIRFAGLQNVRIYVQGLNLLTIDGLKRVNMDPETRDGDGAWYPIQKVFNFGIDITY